MISGPKMAYFNLTIFGWFLYTEQRIDLHMYACARQSVILSIH